MNPSKRIGISLLILFLFTISESYLFCKPASGGEKPEMQEYLKKYPLPAHNVELTRMKSFPNEMQIDKDIFLKGAYSLAIDNRANHIYVCDNDDHRLLVFDLKGNFIKQIGRKGQGPGDLFRPITVMLWKDLIVVNDVGNLRVQFLDKNGDYIKSFRTFKTYSSMAIDKEGLLYGVSTSNYKEPHLIDVLNSKGTLLYSFGKKLKYQPNYVSLRQIKLFIDNSDHIYVAHTSFSIIQKYSKKGELIWQASLDYPIMNDLVSQYKTQLESNPVSNRVRISFDDFCIHENYIFVARFFPRFEIVKFDLSGKAMQVFWNTEFRNYLLFDFNLREVEGKYLFYVARVLPDRQIDVFNY